MDNKNKDKRFSINQGTNKKNKNQRQRNEKSFNFCIFFSFTKISKSFSVFSVPISIFDKAYWVNSRSTFFFESAFWRLPFASSMISSATFRLDLHLTISASNNSLALVASTCFVKSSFFYSFQLPEFRSKLFLLFGPLRTYCRIILLP